MKKLLLFSIVVLLFISGCAQSYSFPEETVKFFLDSIIQGKYEEALNSIVDSNGNPLSRDLKTTILSGLQQTPLLTYEIKKITDLNMTSPQYSFLKNTFKEGKVVEVDLVGKNTQKPQESKFPLVKKEGIWKIIAPTLVQSPTTIPTTTETPTSQLTSTQDPSLLRGLWKAEKTFTAKNGKWEEDKDSSAGIDYQEFKDDKFCRLWTTTNICTEYYSYIISGDKIVVKIYGSTPENEIIQWEFQDNKLVLTFGSKARGIYTKIPGTADRKTDKEKPIIKSFTSNKLSVKLGTEITLTCSATDNDFITEMEINVTATGYEGRKIGFPEGGSLNYTFNTTVPGKHIAVCQAKDANNNEAHSTITFSAS